MKFYILPLLIALCFCCKSRTDESAPASGVVNTSTPVSHTINASAQSNSARTALPGLNFGISVKEYQAANMYMIQGLGANSYFVKPLFDNDSKLFKIELLGLSYNASFSDTKLFDDHKNLVKFFEESNGSPKILSSGFKLNQMKPGETKWTHVWAGQNKRIKVGISEGASGNTYEVVGWVYDQSMLDHQNKTAYLASSAGKKDSGETIRRVKGKRAHKRKANGDQH